MKKKVISVILAVSMVASMTACGSSGGSSGGGTASNTTSQTETPNEEKTDAAVVENSASLTDKANIDNSVERDSITIGWQDATTLAPWGTNNDTPGL